MEKLSSRQQEVYDFIARYFNETGYCPAMADIAKGLNLHDSTIVAHVSKLKEKGYVTSDYRIGRSLRAVKPEMELAGIGR
jgi:repressor LexA